MKFFKNLVLVVGLFSVVTLSAQEAVTLPQVVCDLKWDDYVGGTLPQVPSPTILSNTVLLPASLAGEELPGSTPSEYYYDIFIYGVPIRGGYRYPGPITIPMIPQIPQCHLRINRFMLASDGNPRGVEILVQGDPTMDGLQLLVHVYGNVSLAWGSKPVWALSMKYTHIYPEPDPAAPPTCVRAEPGMYSTTATAGGFAVYAVGVSSNVTSVFFPTWGDTGGQDDLVWYPGEKQAGGTVWKAMVDLGNHKVGNPEYGQFNVHVYMNTSAAQNQWCGTANFRRN